MRITDNFFLFYNKADIISFDIFDTLLCRTVATPQSVWEYLESWENKPGFSQARLQADHISYAKATERGGETTIEEAYDLMDESYKGLLDKELSLERRILSANIEMLDLWNRAGKDGKIRVLTSDMYLPKRFLESVLTENGITGWNHLYLSRDYNARKTTGALYKVIMKDFNVLPEQILHIGDNEYSDITIPLSLGIKAIHYPKIIERTYIEFPFLKSIDSHVSGTLGLAWHEFSYNNPNHTYWNKLGFILGGVLGYIYVKWIVDVSHKLGKDRILFVARDGYILQKICTELFPELRTNYIYAPRTVSIAVNGVEGNNPQAVNERKAYFEEFLKNEDLGQLRSQYSEYISSLNIDNDRCVLVDGCSSEFSSQRLLEAITGKPIFSFFISAMAKKHNAGSLFSTSFYCMPFQMISEFIFGSPEKPIWNVNKEGPIYRTAISSQEEFKISVCDEMAQGAIACAKALYKEQINITPEEWVEYSNAFMQNLTEEDISNLKKAENAGDVQQKQFLSVIWAPDTKQGLRIKRIGRLGHSFSILKGRMLHEITITRNGIHTRHENRNYSTLEIEY